MAQAELAATALRGLGHAVALVPLSTQGDRDRRRTFAEIGGRGIFATEIEEALRDGRVDVAVHSAKDLTGEEADGLAFGACLERADPRDAWVGPARSWAEVPEGARVATSSLRRSSQLTRLRPDLRIEPVRGNVDTRLRKRTERGLDGVILAACGLDRLGLGDEIGFRIEPARDAARVGPGHRRAAGAGRRGAARGGAPTTPTAPWRSPAERAVTRRAGGRLHRAGRRARGAHRRRPAGGCWPTPTATA